MAAACVRCKESMILSDVQWWRGVVVQVKPGRDDDSAEAFQQFRRGVTRGSV